MEEIILLLSVLIKSLLINTTPSTDFDVHRNWKNITSSTHISNWYYDERSVWTLDYPPLFAYLEYLLGSLINKINDISKVNINLTKDYIESDQKTLDFPLLIFQRITVILLGDLVLFIGIKKISKFFNRKYSLYFSLLLFGGLIIVDNIHFQYNTFLYGIFIISISYMIEKRFLLSAFSFSILLCFKHIFLYFAPAYFIFILEEYVIKHKSAFRFTKVASVVILVFLLSFSPFIYLSYINNDYSLFKQIFKRLFPAERGLVHSYWAANFWALYSFMDKVIYFTLSKLKLVQLNNINLTAIGKVHISEFNILPNINIYTANTVVLSLVLIMISKTLFNQKTKKDNEIETKQDDKIESFLKLLYSSGLIFFYFGYHVHEKSIIGLGIISALFYLFKFINQESNQENLLMIDLICLFTQIPLIHNSNDYITKLALCCFYITIKFILLERKRFLFFIRIFLMALFYLFLDFLVSVLIPYYKMNKIENNFSGLLTKYEFLPLMLISVVGSFDFLICSVKLLIS